MYIWIIVYSAFDAKISLKNTVSMRPTPGETYAFITENVASIFQSFLIRNNWTEIIYTWNYICKIVIQIKKHSVFSHVLQVR